MEDNVNLELTLSLNSSQDRSKTTNHAITEMEADRVDAGLDTVVKSEIGGSNSALVKRGRGRPRKSEVDRNRLSPTKLPPRTSNQPSGSEEKRGRGRPRGSGKLQSLAPIGMSFFPLIFFFMNIYCF
ncbi:putative AT hook, DNA-binding protein [Medicago truncatula]|uniref:Putative AT hook, DNA-binding protein n=1 Tax=Medicago truncatula TaxID=3880 RepID=A0A396I786_MEDTR|nr:putative AT hook, DNA-binding protein [Medicago truncatula]